MEWVINHRKQGENEYLYDLNPYNKRMWDDADSKNQCFIRFVFSKTLIPLYGVVWLIAFFQYSILCLFIVFVYKVLTDCVNIWGNFVGVGMVKVKTELMSV